jgi:ArsR family transcriptional regulator
MVAAARDRLGAAGNVVFVLADAQRLPMEDGAFDYALMLHVLTQLPQPAHAIAEALRVLRPGGELALATLDAHDDAEATAAYGDVHAGFSVASLRRMLGRAGFDVEACDVSCVDRRPPHYGVITAFASKPHPKGNA